MNINNQGTFMQNTPQFNITNQSSGLNINNNQTSTLNNFSFGPGKTSVQQSSTSIPFGQSNPTQQPMFGGTGQNQIKSQTNQGQGMFGQTQTTGNMFSQQGQGIQYGKPQISSNLNIPNQNNYQNYINPNTIPNPKVFTLPTTNVLRYDKVSSLPYENTNQVLVEIELPLKNNMILLETSEKDLKYVNESFNELVNQGSLLVKYVKFLKSRSANLDIIAQNLKNLNSLQMEILYNQKKNYSIIHEFNININTPNEYFLHMIKEIEEKIYFQSLQYKDIYSLINIHFQKERGNFRSNPDIIEEIIRDLAEGLEFLVTETSYYNDLCNNIIKNYEEYMMNRFGFKEEEIQHRLKNI